MGKCSFNVIFNELCLRLEQSGLVEDLSEEFEKLPFESKVPFCYKLLLSEALMPVKLEDTNNYKSREKSVEFKRDGNVAFLRKNDKEAIKYYCKAICFAPNGSEEISICYANRSAVLYSLGRYQLCVSDIDRALVGLYPDGLRCKLLERKGKCLLQLQENHLAKECFLEGLKLLTCSSLSDLKQKHMESSIKEYLTVCDDIDNGDKITGISSFKRPLVPQLRLVNKDIPNAFEYLQVEYSESMGRYVTACRDIFPGEVLVVEKPYASISLPQFNITHCHCCFRRCLAMIPCPNCTLVMFCSEKCKNESWRTYHRIECYILPYIISLDFDKMHILAVRILMMATNQGDSIRDLNKSIEEYPCTDNRTKGFNLNGKYLSEDYCAVHYLEGNIDKRTVADLFRRASEMSILLHLIKEKSPFFDQYIITNNVNNVVLTENGIKHTREIKEFANHNLNYTEELTEVESFIGCLLLRYSCIIPCNAHEVSEIIKKDMQDLKILNDCLEIGACLYPMLSLVNHSCDPNVVRHSYGDTNVLTAIKPIKTNEQVFDNYGYHYAVHSCKMRQVQLCLQYFFKCECDACRFDWPRYEELPQEIEFISNDETLIQKLLNSSKKFEKILKKIINSDTEGYLPYLYEHLALLHQSVRTPVKQYSDCQEVIKQCLAIQANCYCDKTDVIIRI